MALVITGGIQFTGGFTWINPPITYLTDPYYNYTVLHLAGETPQPLFLSDASVNINSITTAGNVTGSQFSPVSTPGYYSLAFNGSTGYMALGGGSVFAFGTANWTIECWVQFNTVGGASQVIYASSNLGSYVTAPDIYINSSGKFVIQVGATLVISGTGPTTVLAGPWYHVALARNGATSNLFVNGRFEASYADAYTYTIGTNRPLLGVYAYAVSSYLNGSISNLRVVAGTALYTANFTPPTQPLTAIGTQTSALVGAGPSIASDYSGRSNAITSAGSVRVQTVNPFGTAPDSATITQYSDGYYSNLFNGNTSILAISTPATYLDIGASGPCSLECWVYTTATQTGAVFLSKDGVYNAYYHEYAFTIISGVVTFNVGIATGAVTTQAMSMGTPVLNVWNHVAASRLGTTWYLYLNGQLTNVVAQTVTPTPGGRGIYIGNQPNGAAGTGAFAGYVSNVRIVIGSVIYSGVSFTPPTQPLTAVNGTQTVLLTCLNGQLTDSSPWAATMTNTSSFVTVSTLSPLTPPTAQVTGVTSYGSGQFDGTTGYLRTAYTPSINLSSGNWTIDGWAYWNGTTTSSTLLDKDGVSGSSYPSYNIGLTSAGFLTGTVGSGTGTTYVQTVTSNVVITTSSWVHFAFVKAGTSATLYQNGVSVTATNLTGTLVDGGKPLNIGYQTGQAATSYWNGYLSNLRIVKGAALYNSNFAPLYQPSTTAVTAGATSLLTLQYKQSNNNSVFRDDSPNNYAITLVGTPTQGTFTPFSQNGWSYYFDGSSGYLAPQVGTYSFTGNFTIECWIYDTGTTAYGVPWSWRSGSWTGGLLSRNNSSNNLIFQWNNGPSITQTSNTYTPNTWHHVAVTLLGTTVTLWVDGLSVGTGSLTPPFVMGTNALNLGSDPLNRIASTYLSGYISNFRVVNGTALYTANFTPPTASLTTATGTTGTVTLLTAQSNRFVDNSTSSNVITPTGSVAVKSFSPFANITLPTGSYSYYFAVLDTSYISISNNALLDFGANNFTVECWIFPITYDAVDGGFMAVGPQGGGASWILRGTSAGAVSFVTWSGGTTVDVNFTSGSGYLALNAWSHVAVTRNGTLFTIWVNGVSAITGTSSNAIGNGGRPAYINYSYGGGARTNICYISNVRWTNGTALYTTTFTPPTGPLTAVSGTVLLTAQNNSFADASTVSNALTVNGSVQALLVSPFNTTSIPVSTNNSYSTTLVGGSMYFNGSTDTISIPMTTSFTLGSGNYTLECWIFLTSGSGSTYGQTVVGTSTGSGPGWGLVVNRTVAGQGFIWAINNVIVLSYTAAYLNAGQWYHIAIVRNGTGTNNTVGYLNGVVVVQTTDNTNDTYTAIPLWVGSQNNNGAAQNFPGYISNLRLVKGAAVYTANFTPPTQPLTVYGTQTSLLTCMSPNFTDLSNSNSTLTVVGTAKVQPNHPFGAPSSTVNNYTNGYFSNYFNGSSYLSFVSSPIFAFGTNNFTVETWVSLTSFTNNRFIEGVTGTGGFELLIASGGFPSWGKYGVGAILTSNTAITLNTWYHIAVVRSYSFTFMYINGAIVGAVADSYSYPQTAVRIGADAGPTYYFNGLVSNLRIVNGTALYNNSFTPPTQPLTVVNSTQTSLLICLNQSLTDSSIYANTVTNTGAVGVTVSTRSPFTPPTTSTSVTTLGSGRFDGSTGYLTSPASTNWAFGSGDFTIEFWTYPTVMATSAVFVGVWTGTASSSAWLVSVGATDNTKLRFGYSDGSTINYVESTTGAVTFNAWVHVAIVRTSGVLNIFSNGAAVYNASLTTTFASPTSGISVAEANLGNWGQFYMSNLRIVKGAAVYTTNFAVPNQQLTAATGTTGTTALLTLQNRQSHNNSVFYDDSSNNYAITLVGTPTQGTFTPFSQNGWSYYFNGTSDYLQIASNAVFAFSGAFTVEGWFNWQTTPAAGQLVGVLTANGFNISYNNTTLSFNIFGSSSVASATFTPTLGIWYHIAMTRNASNNCTIWINGVSSGTGTSSQSFAQGAWTIYGGSNNGGNGYISNLRVVKGTAVYTSAFTPSTTPLTTATGTTGTVTLLTAQSNRFVDNSTSSNVITPTGSVAVKSFSPFANSALISNSYSTTLVGGSMYFNGSTDYLTASSPNMSGNWTVEFWAYWTTTGVQTSMVSFNNGSNTGINLSKNTSNQLVADDGQNPQTAFSLTTPTMFAWNHIAYVRSGTTTTAYVNGIVAGSNTFTPQTVSYVNVGRYSGGGYYHTGYISNLRIVNGAALYTANFTPPTQPLTVISTVTSISTSTSTIASTSLLLLGTNAGVVDQTGRNDLITAGTATITASTFKYGAGSIYIPGTGNYVQTISTNTNYGFPTSLTTFTIESWIYMTQLPTGAYPSMIGDMTPTSTTDNWSFGPISTGQLQFYWNPGSATTVTGNTVMSTSTWNHVAISVNTGTIGLFVNGVNQTLTGTTTLTARSSTLNYLTLGQWTSGSYQYYGYIDDLRVTSGVGRYSTGTNFTPPTQNPVQ